MRILHLFPDDQKFLEDARNFFELRGVENTWLIIDDGLVVSAIQKENSISSDAILDDSSCSIIEQSLIKHDIWFIHYCDERLIPIINKFASVKPLIIQLWGGDYVRFSNSISQILEKETYRIAIHQQSKVKHFPLGIARTYHEFKWRFNQENKNYFNALSKAKEIWTLLGETENALFAAYPNLNLVQRKVIYGEFSKSKITPTHAQTKIILGNSANPTNNHLDALNCLEEYSEAFVHCFLPMSYGGDSGYIERVAENIPLKLAEKTTIIRDFLPKDTYHKLLRECDVLVMNHVRQQALGNILVGLSCGKTIYLNPKGVLWKYFSSKGYTIRNIESIKQEGIQKVTRRQAQENQKLVLESWIPSPAETGRHLRSLTNA